MHATPWFRSPLQLCTFVADLSHLAAEDQTDPKLIRDLLAKIDEAGGNDGRIIQTHGRATTGHPLLNQGDHSSSSRLLLTPCVWMGVSGLRVDISRTPQVVASSRDSMFVPIATVLLSDLVTLCRTEVLRALAKAVQKLETSPDDARRATLLRCVMDQGIRFEDKVLFEEVFDVSRWIPMGTDTLAERCSAVARLVAHTVRASATESQLEDTLRAFVDRLRDDVDVEDDWIMTLVSRDTPLDAMVEAIFKPTLRQTLPSDSHDPAFCDIRLLTYPLVTSWPIARGATEILLADVLQDVAAMIPDLADTVLATPLPFTSLLVRNAAGSTLTHARGTPHRYAEDPERFLGMTPDNHCTLAALQGLMHLVPSVTSRLGSVVSILRNTGGFGPLLAGENHAILSESVRAVFAGIEQPPKVQRDVSLESLYAVQSLAADHAQQESVRRKASTSKPKKPKKAAVAKPDSPAAVVQDTDDTVVGLTAAVKPSQKRRPAPSRSKVKSAAAKAPVQPAAKKAKAAVPAEEPMDLDDHWDLDDAEPGDAAF
jgi:hypothetical protein